jgi:hypothetical protein
MQLHIKGLRLVEALFDEVKGLVGKDVGIVIFDQPCVVKISPYVGRIVER